MSIASTLDAIAETGGREPAASEAARSLTPREIREIAVVHVSGLLRLVPETASGNRVGFGNILVDVSPSGDQGSVFYEDVGSGFEVSGVSISRSDGPRRLSDLMYLLYYARDRTDGLLMLPSEMRRQRIGELAEVVGASEEFVRFMLSEYPAIERTLRT